VFGRVEEINRPIAGEFARALRVGATDQGEAVEAAQALVTVAANLAQLEMVTAVESETNSAATISAAES
jgi:hypothetical protein